MDRSRREGIREDKITAHLQRTFFAALLINNQIIAYKKALEYYSNAHLFSFIYHHYYIISVSHSMVNNIYFQSYTNYYKGWSMEKY